MAPMRYSVKPSEEEKKANPLNWEKLKEKTDERYYPRKVQRAKELKCSNLEQGNIGDGI